ncbi:hypothetical protein [Caldicoprobacter faecalis]|uniref:hypothetical protein n=1 Tax=Caldicoprobacter faecalis TaxID=937334 RepID=UPI0011602913|nr:hypothetical protein [Caldicoprobacter faecalis]
MAASRFKEKRDKRLISRIFRSLTTYPFYFLLPYSLILFPYPFSIGITFFAWGKGLNEIYNIVNLKKTLSISLSSNPHEFYMGFFGR